MNTNSSVNVETDIVVIGGGGAGLSAAMAALESKARVVVVEKRGLGGNSAMANGLFAAESQVQKRQLIDCRRDDCFRTAMDWQHWRTNPRILRAFIDKSGDTISWLEAKGLSFECISSYPNQIAPSWHVVEGSGAKLIKVLADDCRRLSAELYIQTPAKKILCEGSGEIRGVVVEQEGKEILISAKSVIIATGGYGSNKELLKKYCMDYDENMELVGVKGNTGDGILMAMEIGALTEGLGILHMMGPNISFKGTMMHLQAGGTSEQIKVALMTIALEPNTIWVNKRGRRFIDEGNSPHIYENVNALVRQPDKTAYSLLDSEMIRGIAKQGFNLGPTKNNGTRGNTLEGLEKELGILAEKDKLKIADSWDEIALWIGAKPEDLKAEIDAYNSFCDDRYDAVFNKERRYLDPLRVPPYYAIRTNVAYHHTFGGIKINEDMKVIGSQDQPIPGLFAAGVDTGGWQTETYSGTLSGLAFGFAINSGRIAGENAARYVLRKDRC